MKVCCQIILKVCIKFNKLYKETDRCNIITWGGGGATFLIHKKKKKKKKSQPHYFTKKNDEHL